MKGERHRLINASYSQDKTETRIAYGAMFFNGAILVSGWLISKNLLL
jgi:hypothetical protein